MLGGLTYTSEELLARPEMTEDGNCVLLGRIVRILRGPGAGIHGQIATVRADGIYKAKARGFTATGLRRCDFEVLP